MECSKCDRFGCTCQTEAAKTEQPVGLSDDIRKDFEDFVSRGGDSDWRRYLERDANGDYELGVARGGWAAWQGAIHRYRLKREIVDAWQDKSDQWQDSIDAAHPTKTGKHDTYAKALDMVGNRHSKGALVDLVNWLLAYRRPHQATTVLVADVEKAKAGLMAIFDDSKWNPLFRMGVSHSISFFDELLDGRPATKTDIEDGVANNG